MHTAPLRSAPLSTVSATALPLPLNCAQSSQWHSARASLRDAHAYTQFQPPQLLVINVEDTDFRDMLLDFRQTRAGVRCAVHLTFTSWQVAFSCTAGTWDQAVQPGVVAAAYHTIFICVNTVQ